jgi:Reverse transcriptase (RNA-dependent DNA polymerase)
MITRSQRNLLHKPDVARRLPDSDLPASSTGVDGDESVATFKHTTVDVHAVTKRTQPSEKNPLGQIEGPSVANSVKQSKVGQWSNREETELKRLVGIHTDPKGTVSWVKVVEAWNSLKLPLRTKASLSSKWYDIKPRTIVLDSAKAQNSSVSGRTSEIGDLPSDVNTTPEVNIAVKPKKKKSPEVPKCPAPVNSNVKLEKKEEDCSGNDDVVKATFDKYLKKSRRIDCKVYRIPPRRVIPNFHTQSITNMVDLLMKKEVDQKMKGTPSWNQLSVLVYAGALTVDRICNQSSDEKRLRSKMWFISTYGEVKKLRKIIGKASAELNRRKNIAEVIPTDQQLNNIRLLERKYKCRSFDEITSLVEKLKCRLQLLLSRIDLRKADEQRQKVRRQPTKMLFRDKVTKESPDTVNINDIRRYWKKIVGMKKTFEHKNPLLNAWKQTLPESPVGKDPKDLLTMDVWQRVVSKIKPWKAPGPDGLQSFWWKSFKTASTSLFRLVYDHLTSGKPLPQKWISNGRIILLYKSGSRSDPANYRPIACLNTCYKLLTGYVTAYLEEFVTERCILAKEQRALQKGIWGCTHALIIDQTLIADAQGQKQRPISVGWIDYAKAFDSVPHSYINWLFRVMRVPEPLRKFLKGLMNSWTVKYEAKSPRGKTERSSLLRIRSGVLQGDSFSPLLFCLAMVPISHALNNTKYGYTTASGKLTKTQLTVTHQFYMDDLKLYADSELSLRKLLRIVETISSAISMKVNLKKCAMAHFVPKRLQTETTTGVDKSTIEEEIPILEGGLFYKYLGIEQEFTSKESFTWDRVKDRCIARFRTIWQSDLTFRQKVDTYNSTIIPALTYVSSNIIRGGGKYDSVLGQGGKLDIKFRAILKKEKARYKAASKHRLYLSVEEGGCGLKSIRDAIEESTIYTWAYVSTRADLKASYNLFNSMLKRSKRSILSDARRVLNDYKIEVVREETTPAVILGGVRYVEATVLARQVVELMRKANNIRRRKKWKDLKLAGRVLQPEQVIDVATSFEWLRKGRLSSVSVRNVLAAQEGCLLTRTHQAYRNTSQGIGCRKCRDAMETIEHVISCCKHWLTTLYIDRHDSVARNIHYILCQRFNVQPPHYTQRITPVLETDSIRLYWNQPIQTRTVIRHNKPDLVAFHKVNKTALVIEVAVSWFTGLEKQKQIKINRYSVNGNYEDVLATPYPTGDNLIKELKSAGWHVTFLVVVVGATGEVLLDLKEELKDKLCLTSQASLKLIERLQRSAVLGTSRIIQNHLSNEGVRVRP